MESQEFVAPADADTEANVAQGAVPLDFQGGPVDSALWEAQFDEFGKLKRVELLKKLVFLRGVVPAMRRDVWKFVSGYYSWDSTSAEREERREKKAKEYYSMKKQWETITPTQEKHFSKFKERKTQIEQDVLRPDSRYQVMFAGENSHIPQMMYNVLMTYCMYNFDQGYKKGMCTLLVPLVKAMENEVDAFWCFVGVVKRMN